MWRSLQDAFEHEEPIDLGIPIEATDVLKGPDLQAAYLAARGKPGSSALILAGGHWLNDFDAAERVKEELARYDEHTDAFAELPEAGELDAALERVAAAFGRDPMSVLHRLDPDTLLAIEEGDEDAIDPDALAADDLREAYDAELAQRRELRAAAEPGMLMLSRGPLRTYDVETAVRELAPPEGRVVRLATTPAKAMLYLGFGGWNACPNPHQQARVWEHWASTIGGEPAVVSEDTLGAICTAPVASRKGLVQLAREVIAYDGDMGMEGYLFLLGTLFRNTSLTFWWD